METTHQLNRQNSHNEHHASRQFMIRRSPLVQSTGMVYTADQLVAYALEELRDNNLFLDGRLAASMEQ